MLGEYLELSYEKEKKASAERSLVEALKTLPKSELFKLATGRTKLASEPDWLEQFKGTAFFDQAVALEQEQLQMDLENLQTREQNRVMDDRRDTIEVKKKLLTLQVASEGQAQEDAAVQEEAAVQDQAQAEAEAAPPPPTSKKTTIEEKTANALASLGTKALGLAKANPGLVAGAALGAGAGALRGDGQGGGRLSGALAGAAGGAALGGAAQVGVGAARTLAKGGKPLTLNSVGSALKGSYNNTVARSANAVGASKQQAQSMMMMGVKKPGLQPAPQLPPASNGALSPKA